MTFLPVWYSALSFWIFLAGREGPVWALVAWLMIAAAAGVQALVLAKCRRAFARWVLPAVGGSIMALSCLASCIIFLQAENVWLIFGLAVANVFVWYLYLGAALGWAARAVFHHIRAKHRH